MIRLCEICVGNYFKVGGKTYMVTAVYGEKKAVSLAGREFLTYVNDLAPIPLSKELLEENGFVEESVQEHHLRLWYSKDRRVKVSYWVEDGTWDVHVDNERFETVGGCKIEYVHEFQNFLTQCKYEVKFVLKEDSK